MPIADSSRCRLFCLLLLSGVALAGTAPVCALAMADPLPPGVRGELEPWGFVPRWSPLAVLAGSGIGAAYAAFVAVGYRLLQPAASLPSQATPSGPAAQPHRSATILLAGLVPVSCALSLGL